VQAKRRFVAKARKQEELRVRLAAGRASFAAKVAKDKEKRMQALLAERRGLMERQQSEE